MAGKTTKDEQPKDAANENQTENPQVDEQEESPVTIAERSLRQPVEEKDLPEQTAYQE